MNLLYIGYWELGDGLTQATVLPHLRILLASEKIEKLVFVTIERGVYKADIATLPPSHKLIYQPLVSKNFPINLLNKVNDFINFPNKLLKLLDDYAIEKVIARSSPAGALIHQLCERRNIPFFVESFEPHAEYMLESGVWSKWDPRTIFQKKWEKHIKKSAGGLLPVSKNFKNRLMKEGVPSDKIFTVACNVNLEQFSFNVLDRDRIRKSLEIPSDAWVGIYVGKFGGSYYDEETFNLFKKILEVQHSYFIILSPDKEEFIKEKIRKCGLSEEDFRISFAKHSEVSAYLSAADYGFAPVKPSASKKFVSVTKVGEYWACGIPVIITEDIGDDSDTVRDKKAGVVLANDWMDQPIDYFKQLVQQMKAINNRAYIRSIAEETRNMNNSVLAYRYFQLI
jgi:glycosyltransferase involved in cell wall biosynthesis